MNSQASTSAKASYITSEGWVTMNGLEHFFYSDFHLNDGWKLRWSIQLLLDQWCEPQELHLYFLSAMLLQIRAASDAMARPFAAKLNLPIWTSIFPRSLFFCQTNSCNFWKGVDRCRSQVQFCNSMISLKEHFQPLLHPYGGSVSQHLGTVDIAWRIDAWNRCFHIHWPWSVHDPIQTSTSPVPSRSGTRPIEEELC